MRVRLLLLLAVAGCASPDPAPAPPPPAPVAERGAPPPPSPLPRVALAVGTVIDGVEADPTELQGVLFGLLGQRGLRVECLAPFRDPEREAAARAEAALAEREGQPVALRITGEVQATYADAAFYGQPLAHNFHGRIDLLLTDDQGTVLRRISFLHSWGRLRHTRSLDATLRDWEDVVHATVAVGILSHPRLQALLPEAQRGPLREQLAEVKARVLERLDRSAPDCEAAQLLRSW